MFEKYDAYKDSGVDWIGDIPADWDALKLKNVAFINPTNTALSNSLDKNTQVCFLAMENVEANGTVNYQNKRRLASVKSGFTNFIKNDVLVAKITPCFENGKGALLDQLDSEIGFGSTEFHVLRSKHNCHPKFLYYLTKSHNFMDFGEGMMIGSAGQKRVPTDFIENFNVALPNKTLQGEIAKFLDAKTIEIEQVIAIKEQQIALLNERKQIVIQKAVTQGLDPNVPTKESGVEWIGQIPEHWECKPSRYAFRATKRFKRDGTEIKFSVTQKWGVIPTDEMKESATQAVSFEGFQICLEDDLVLNKYKAHLGVFWRAPSRGLITGNYTVFEPLKGINSKYFELLYHTPVYIDIFRTIVYGVIEGMMPLYNNDFYDMLSIVPPLEEQLAIVQYVGEQQKEFSKIERVFLGQIEKLKEYKTTLINDTVTGKIKVA